MKKLIKSRILKIVASTVAISLCTIPFNIFANDKDTTITIYNANNIHSNVEKIANDNKSNKKVSESLKEVIGHTTTEIYAFGKDGTRLVHIEETPMGDLIADSMVYATEKLLEGTKYKNLPIVALENGGNICANISAGDITLEDIFNVLPFGNIISVKIITPDKLYNVLENGVSKMTIDENGKIDGLDGRFPQISGMRIEIDITKKPFNPDKLENGNGERVTSIYLVDKEGNEKLLDRNDTTTEIAFASNDFVIAGGDGYTAISNLKHIAEGEGLDNVLTEYIKLLTEKGNGNFEYKMRNNRIKVINLNNEVNSNEEKKQFKTLNIKNFLSLKENTQVEYYLDIPETPVHWADEAIYYLKALGIFGNEKYFFPNKNVTYLEFSEIIQKLLGLETSNLEEYGLLQGINKPEENKLLTREEVAYILANIIKSYNIETKNVESPKVVENVSKYAIENINLALQKGIIKGDEKGNLNLNKNITKAELSVMLNNLVYLYFE